MGLATLKQKCNEMRKDIVTMIADASSGHPGGSLSAVELVGALFLDKLQIDSKNPKKETRDRFVLSKGHAAPCYYAALVQAGFIEKSELKNFRKIYSILQGHPDSKKVPGVDASTGSLGQGVSIAVGMALGAKQQQLSNHTYVLLGDGELQEGQVWEAFMAASHYKLDNLTIMIDNNNLQIDGTNDEVMSLGNLKAKCSSFGLGVIEIEDGNNLEQVVEALGKPTNKGIPKCIIAHTIKGKGISFMENQVCWHGKAPNKDEKEKALAELEVQCG